MTYTEMSERFEKLWKLREHITKTPTPKEGIDWKGLCREFFDYGAVSIIRILEKEKARGGS